VSIYDCAAMSTFCSARKNSDARIPESYGLRVQSIRRRLQLYLEVWRGGEVL
jgi:hypothetical protein